MSTQTALLVTEVGKPVTSTNTWPIPQPGPKQIQLRVTVAGLNPHDHKSRDGGLFIQDSLPAVLGNDVAGVVTALGPNSSRFKVGDRVFAQSNLSPKSEQKGLQQQVVVDEDYAALVPEGFTEGDGVSLPTNIIAGLVGLFDESALGIPAPWTDAAKTFDYPNTTLLIIGGGSNCGKYAVQLAKMVGIGKIVTVGGDEHQLKGYGATHVLGRHGGHDIVLQRIRAVVGDDLIYAYDAINPPEDQILGVNALSNTKKGKLARLVPSGDIDESNMLPKQAGYELKNVFGISHIRPEVSKPFWERLGEYLMQGKIEPLPYVTVKGLDAAKVNEVLDGYRDGKPTTKTHFQISE
ncbi:putative alcohol dehydrogenase [Lindgomyces ingoldianus]|uniref:Alcohol dehydrogenase n=1 Tax=Lindgomyces ingoldianus TaxID=673940 RepID=A0ACB6QVK4_9PLEO|nr:putative alcohol dehydrogenase [Lindgomyces ingoldianus]KAF2470910.1 putative alcohol dehydrogenase [Lindgomyces ingoldianus]